MSRFSREAMLTRHVAAYLKRKGYARQHFEVPFYDRRIDLMGFSKRVGKIASVELKLKKWQKAFQQALIYQLCSDVVFIALPEEKAKTVKLEKFKRHGVGLLGVSADGRTRAFCKAAQSTVIKRSYKKRYSEYLAAAN